jgi:hypothetical protein
MFPSRSSLPALTAFARPGPGANRSPTSSLVLGHRTPSTSSAPAFAGRPPVFPWASLPRVDACSACRTAFTVTPTDRASTGRRVGGWSPVPRGPDGLPRKAEGLPGYWGVHLAYVPQSNIPPVPRELALPLYGDAAFRVTDPLRSRLVVYFGTATLRPASSPTYASTAPLLEQQQGWLPACWLGFWPGGI